jgi:putative membrane protein
MSLLHDVTWQPWEVSASLTPAVVVSGLLYIRGFLRSRSTSPKTIPASRATGFLVGLFLIWIAVASPIASLDHQLLTVHMIQHLLLMTFAPPFILWGFPVRCFAHLLPRQLAQGVIGWLRRPPVQRLGRGAGQLTLCWLAATATLLAWHVPGVFSLGMQSESWHAFEQASFLGAGLLFWWPVVQPWLTASTSPRWSLVLYLFLATLPCDILSGFLVFSDRVAYPVYLSGPHRSRLGALSDQQCAGALMWTAVTIAYVVAGTIVTARLLEVPRYAAATESHS